MRQSRRALNFVGQMTMRVTVDGVEMDLKTGATIHEVLNLLNLNREGVVVSVNGEIVIEEKRLEKGDSVRFIPAVSGG